MCGLTGLFCPTGSSATELGERTSAMTATLAHRGPDADGVWLDAQAGICLGHRRLSIVELSAAGSQPMSSANDRWVTVYNGELYNTEDLRSEIEKTGHHINWRGHSDTEVILEAVAYWGVVEATKRFNGIFALALWDRRDRQLWLIRDRLGIKPLYWGRLPNGGLLFGSELRALRAHPQFDATINMSAVAGYLRSACVAAPLTIYSKAWKVPPAHMLCISANAEPLSICYWNLRELAAAGQSKLDQRPDDEVTDELEALLSDAVGRQMVADVPLGAFLSGGIDSSTVVALMQKQSRRPVKTFSIGFQEEEYSEAAHARRVAAHLGTEHTELIVEPAAAQAVIGRLPDIYDEPFADASQIPTFLVSELARRHVTVALSGDGGDECFAGYTRYHWIDQLSRLTAAVPGAVLRAASGTLRALSPDTWDALLSPIPRKLRPTHVGDKIHKGASLLALRGTDQIYRDMVAQWSDPTQAAPGATEPTGIWDDASIANDLPDRVARLRYFDMMHYLPDDILTKVDRASMAVSLEARVPLLDHRVVDYAWRLPRRQLGNGRQGKRILRRILHRHVPASLVERPKMGFGIPIGEWIRGPLSQWAADLLSEDALRKTGFFDAAVIRGRFQEHLAGRRNWQNSLWTILMFQAWHRRWC
ncbi:MAG: asparagine synthase (glutamine-hydrolyzing) [Pseudolabrys sp.]